MSTISNTLNRLIETLNDGKLGFTTAANDAQRPDLKTFLAELAAERAEFAAELHQHVQALGASPEESGSVAGDLHRGWITLKAAVANREDLAILEECERGEDSAVSNYREALEEEIGPVRGIVESQFARVKAAHDQVRALRDSFQTINA